MMDFNGVDFCRFKGTVTDKDAFRLVKEGWVFCPKQEWKENVRDVGKKAKKEVKEVVEKVKVIKDKTHYKGKKGVKSSKK